MKYILTFILGAFSFWFISSAEYTPEVRKDRSSTDSNPWLQEEHVPTEKGYLHNMPCHGGESATITANIEDSGCYTLDWGEIEDNCYLTSQNVKICKD